MPEDSKKNHDKKKGDPKEQRRPKQRHQPSGAEKKSEKKAEDSKNVPKVPQKPVYESPPPEFYQNLKRETDEILKITEEESSKYKKKEIQSNWSKYEVPIDSYEEIEEHENLGADYEKLIQAPLSIGGHFQFKHEKSWDINTGPSLYDKYFEINMEELNIALCSIPFYERNSIDESNFSQTDLLTMNNRATRFKQKYYNDKSYSTPETEAQDKILSGLRESVKEDNEERDKDSKDIEITCTDNDRKISETENSPSIADDSTINFKLIETKTEPLLEVKHEPLINESEPTHLPNIEKEIGHDDIVIEDTKKVTKECEVEKVVTPSLVESPVCHIEKIPLPVVEKVLPVAAKVSSVVAKVDPAPAVPKVADPPSATKKNPVIESPEDLEKWLDDFLDG